MSKLTPGQEKFVENYAKDLNGRRAYLAVYPSVTAGSADVGASRMLSKAKVAKAVQEALDRKSRRVELEADDIIRELMRVAYGDIADHARVVSYTDGEGRQVTTIEATPTADIGEGKTAAVSQIRPTKRGIEVRMHDKLKALELLGKHLAMWTDRIEQVGDSVVKIQLPDGLE